MKKKNLSTRLYATMYKAQTYIATTIFTILLSVNTAFAAATESSGTLWAGAGDGFQAGWEEFCKVYTDRVWIAFTAFAAFKYFKATDDRPKFIAKLGVYGSIGCFLICKVPISVWQSTGDYLSGIFNFT